MILDLDISEKNDSQRNQESFRSITVQAFLDIAGHFTNIKKGSSWLITCDLVSLLLDYSHRRWRNIQPKVRIRLKMGIPGNGSLIRLSMENTRIIA